MGVNLDILSNREFWELKKRVDEVAAAKYADLEASHDREVIDRVGREILLDMPVISNHELKDCMREESAVRGVDSESRPFIAIKLDLIDARTLKKIATVIEVIFRQQDPRSGAGSEELAYTTRPGVINITTDERFESGLFQHPKPHKAYKGAIGGLVNWYKSVAPITLGGADIRPEVMVQEHWDRIKKLLEGEHVDHPYDSRFKMVLNQEERD